MEGRIHNDSVWIFEFLKVFFGVSDIDESRFGRHHWVGLDDHNVGVGGKGVYESGELTVSDLQ